MSEHAAQDAGVWGVDLGARAVSVVHVQPQGSAFAIRNYSRQEVDGSLSSPSATAGVLAAFQTNGQCRGVAGAVPDELVLYRSLTLPNADDATFEKMLRTQVEALLPASTTAGPFGWSWQKRKDPFNPATQRVLVCAVRQAALDAAASAMRDWGKRPTLLVPASVALAAGFRHLVKSDDQCTVLIDVQAHTTSVIVLWDGSIFACAVLGCGSEQLDDPPARSAGLDTAVGITEVGSDEVGSPDAAGTFSDWKQQLGEVYQLVMRDIPRQRRPKRCFIFGRAADSSLLQRHIGEALHLEVIVPAPQVASNGDPAIPLVEGVVAVGAGLCALDRSDAAKSINLLPALAAPASRPVQTFRRWVMLAAWLIAAVLALYGLDLREARLSSETVDRIRASAERQGGLGRQLAVARYLNGIPAPPLEILKVITEQAPPSMVLMSVQYNRSGQVQITGTLPAQDALGELMRKLSESPLLGDVRMRVSRTLSDAEAQSSKVPANKCSFEITMMAKTGTASAPAVVEGGT